MRRKPNTKTKEEQREQKERRQRKTADNCPEQRTATGSVETECTKSAHTETESYNVYIAPLGLHALWVYAVFGHGFYPFRSDG